MVEQALQGDPEAILQLSELFAADILVLGEAFSVVEVVRVPGQTEQLQQGRARVEVRVVEAATGRILKAAVLHTGGLDFYTAPAPAPGAAHAPRAERFAARGSSAGPVPEGARPGGPGGLRQRLRGRADAQLALTNTGRAADGRRCLPLYVISVWMPGSHVLRSDVRKLVILR